MQTVTTLSAMPPAWFVLAGAFAVCGMCVVVAGLLVGNRR